jgi:hypothetical protein
LKRKRIVRTAEMTIETEESVVLRGSPVPRCPVMWCQGCCGQVEMVTPEEAARIAGVNTRMIYRWVEARNIHFVETSEGLLLVCRDSLAGLASVSGTSKLPGAWGGKRGKGYYAFRGFSDTLALGASPDLSPTRRQTNRCPLRVVFGSPHEIPM